VILGKLDSVEVGPPSLPLRPRSSYAPVNIETASTRKQALCCTSYLILMYPSRLSSTELKKLEQQVEYMLELPPI
jgi:hypothetical protein